MRLLKFKTEDIRKLAEHSLKAEKRRLTFDQEKEGVAVPRGLILAKDQGVYLLSNGLNEGEKPPGELGLVVYAENCNPETDKDWYDNARNICGGDDFAEFIDLDWFFYAQSENCEYMVIEITDNIIVLKTDLMKKTNKANNR